MRFNLKKHIIELQTKGITYIEGFYKKKECKNGRNIKNNQKQYYLKNSVYIFNYFEDKKEIENGNTTTTKTLNEFFNINKCVSA